MCPPDITRRFASNNTGNRNVKASGEFFPDHILTFRPQRLGMRGIDRVGPHALTDQTDRLVIGHDRTDVAVFAVMAADRVSRPHYACPDRRGRSLRNGLELERRFAFSRSLFIDPLHHRLDGASLHMTCKFGHDPTGMHRRGAHAARAMPRIKRNGKEDVGRLGALVGGK